MKIKLTKFAQVAALGLALVFTFYCSSDEEGGGGSSSSSGDDNSLVKTVIPVKINNQIWTASNSDLDAIGPFRRCYGDEVTNCKTFGGLYNWEAAKKACPSGWHLPSKDEWAELAEAVGGWEIAGKYLKATSGWNDYKGKSGNGTDVYGFSALPGGYGNSDGEFRDLSKYGYWWSSSEYNSDSAYYRRMDDNNEFDEHYGEKSNFYSVRCVQNQ